MNKRIISLSTAVTVALGMGFPLSVEARAEGMDNVIQKVNQGTKRNVMYYGDWSIWGGQGNFYPKDIPASELTHLNLAFLDFDKDGTLRFTDNDAAVGAPVGMPGVQWNSVNSGLINALQDLRAQNPNMKVGISVGGWSKSGDFSEMAANPQYRKNFVENIMKFVQYTNMDFIDLDWEFPGEVRQPDKIDNQNDEGTPHATPEDKKNFVILLEDLRSALDAQGVKIGKKYELSVALHASVAKLNLGVDIDRVFQLVDFANIMTYDMRGAWDETSGHQAGLYTNPHDPLKGRGLSIDESVNYLISQGAEANKIVIGAAYYSRGWEKVSKGPDAKNPGLFGNAEVVTKDADQTPSKGAKNEAPLKAGDGGRMSGVWSYRNLDKLKAEYPGLKEYWDDTAKAPYLYDEKTGAFFTYENIKSINEKTNYVNENDLGGVIAWMASNDKQTTSTKRDELTITTKKGLFGEAALPTHKIVYDELDVEVLVTPFVQNWGTGGGYEITIKNKEVKNESGTVLEAVEKSGESIKTPKFFIKTDGAKITGGDYKAGSITTEGEYTVVDISKCYDGKVIEQGQSYTFTLNTSKENPVSNDIKEIQMAQHVYDGGTPYGHQTILGETSGPIDPVNKAPYINGAVNKTIYLNESFDKMAGITANDIEDGDLTSKVVVTGDVDTSKVGSYTLTYKVTDSKGLETVVTRVITVTEKVEINNAPQILGAADKTIKLNESFDKMAGVTATDIEDGNLTSNIIVSGEVDVTKAGKYTLIYKVSDSKGLETIVNRVITVVDDSQVPGDNYDPNKVYNTGDVVIYNGHKYTAKWWTQGGVPEGNPAWEKEKVVNPDGSLEYQPGGVYLQGDKVSYNGKIYEALWWTNSTPGSDSSWKQI